MGDLFVVLNRTEAKFLRRSTPTGGLEVFKDLKNPLGRERNKNLKTSRAGSDRFSLKGTTVSHSLTREKDPHEDAAIQFAREVAKEIRNECLSHADQDFTLVADSHMTGILDEVLDKTVLKRQKGVVRKNLNYMSDHELITFIERKVQGE